MKKLFHLLSVFLLTAVMAVSVCACTPSSSGGGNGDSGQTEIDPSIRSVYDLYVESCVKTGEEALTYEEWFASIKGEKGDQGEQGPRGNGWLYGSGVPKSSLGMVGDLYLDYTSWNVYSKEGSGWTLRGNIKGEKGSAGNQDDKDDTSDKEPVDPATQYRNDHTIVFYSAQGQALSKVTDSAIASFEAKYPGWTVDHRQPGGYDEVFSKVCGDLTEGLQPDLAYCYADHVAQYIGSGTVVDMNKYLKNTESYTYTAGQTTKTVDRIGFTEEAVSKFVSGYFEEGVAVNFGGYKAAGYVDDALLTLPFVKTTELLYYNPDALETLGVEVPTTWDELWDICELAKAEWPTCTPLGYDSEANWFITMAAQRGFKYTSTDPNSHYQFNNDGAKQWLSEIAEYHKLGYFTTQQEYGSYTSSLFTRGPEEGGLIFCIGSSGGAANQAGNSFTTEVAPIPGSKCADGTVDYSCISQGPSLVMFSGGRGVTNSSEKEIMTFQFVKELLDVEFQSQFAKASGYNPMRTDVFHVESYARFLEGKDPATGNALTGAQFVVAKAAKAATRLIDRFFVSPAFVGSSTARQQMTNVVQYVMLGQKSPAKALEDALKACGGS